MDRYQQGSARLIGLSALLALAVAFVSGAPAWAEKRLDVAAIEKGYIQSLAPPGATSILHDKA